MKTIIDICNEHGIELKKAGINKYQALCPLHSEDTPSFTIYSDSDSFFCWGCRAGGDAIELLMQLDDVSFLEAKRILYGENLEDYIKDRIKTREKPINYKLLLNKGVSPVAREMIGNGKSLDKILNLLYNLDNESISTQEQFEKKYKEYINKLRSLK